MSYSWKTSNEQQTRKKKFWHFKAQLYLSFLQNVLTNYNIFTKRQWFMHTLSVCLYLEEKPLKGRTGVRAHVFNFDMGQAVEQQQREASNWLEPLATDKERLLCLLLTEQSFTRIWELFSLMHYSCTDTYLHHTLMKEEAWHVALHVQYNVVCIAGRKLKD